MLFFEALEVMFLPTPITLFFVAWIFFIFHFAKKHGSRSVFFSIGYIVFFTLLPILLLSILEYLPGLVDLSFLSSLARSLRWEGLVYIGFAALFYLIGYIVLAILIYFFWPARLEPAEPNPDDSSGYGKRFKRRGYVISLFAFIIFPVSFMFLMSHDRPDTKICIFDSTGECAKNKQRYIMNQLRSRYEVTECISWSRGRRDCLQYGQSFEDYVKGLK